MEIQIGGGIVLCRVDGIAESDDTEHDILLAGAHTIAATTLTTADRRA